MIRVEPGTFLLGMARPRSRSGNLPAEVTSFVGRRGELSEINTRLARARLVNLVGPGGVGKSRLAVRAATDLARRFRAGAWLVELAEVRDPVLVANVVGEALDLRDQAGKEPRETLLSHLRDKQLLLVLDNCEHLLAATAPLVTDLLAASPELRVLATSREPLGIPGEQVVPVPPLPLPEEPGARLDHVRQNDAVALFTERAAAASGRFELTASNQETVVALCRQLDGLPLAIELAAVRTRTLSAAEILERLRDRFGLLAGGGSTTGSRHQTLETTIDWSYDLLTTREQTLLSRLGVFAGRLTLDDAEAVCTSEELPAARMLEVLSSLIDKSLVMREDFRGRSCYRLHETMRAYADARLLRSDPERAWPERCLDHYVTVCSKFAEGARSRLLEWIPWVELEIDNLRGVLRQCLAKGEVSRGLDVAVSLHLYWITRGTAEGIRWVDELLAAGQPSEGRRWRTYHLRGWLSLVQGDPEAARPWILKALTAARATNDPRQLSEALSTASILHSTAGDPGSARRFLDEAEKITRPLGDGAERIDLLEARAVLAFFVSDLDTARAASGEGAALSRAAGDLYHLESMLRNLGVVAMVTGDAGASKPFLLEALTIARQVDHRVAQFYLLAALSWHAATGSEGRLAARLLGAAEAIGTSAGAAIIGPHVPFVSGARDSAVAMLGEPAFAAEHQAGARLPREAALRLALGESEQREDHVDAAEGPLARREVEVARLISEGLSNRQIAARLFISEATVATHVRHILNKLGVDSRAQVARWVAAGNR